ncbi:MAG: nucleotide-binding protein [Melioribacteraceae bacterium]
MRETHLPRHLAAIVLASERGINISKFASDDDLASIRSTAQSSIPSSVVIPRETNVVDSRRVSRNRVHKPKPISRRGNTVFVVHGRNEFARKAIFEFLRAVGLRPIEWNQAIKMTGQPSPYVGDILETVFREAVAVVILLTPDDEARLRKSLRRPKDPPFEKVLTGQARPNVIFEAGMAFGRNPNSTLIVELGNLRPFSDIAGRHVVHLSNQATSRQEFATKLANAGCNVDTSGSDWLTAGDFLLH